MSKSDAFALVDKLKELTEKGILVDRKRLKENICSQFPDWRLWIREYIANSFDAQARTCRVYGYNEGECVTIGVSDDGHGMNRDGIDAFLSKFRSLKVRPEGAVGRFGIGSFSVAAIPGQIGYHMTTSTGKETWRMTTGCLLDDSPIRVDSVKPVKSPGTVFEATFKRSTAGGAREELRQLQFVTRKYLYHLPINVRFEFPEDNYGSIPHLNEWTPGNWVTEPEERFSKRFCFGLGDMDYDVVIGVGQTRHQLYQQRVLIAENHRDHDLIGDSFTPKPFRLPHLSVRVDSPGFEVPIGRHCLCNGHVLKPLARHMRERIIPGYLSELAGIYNKMECDQHGLLPSQLEDMFCSWLALCPHTASDLRRARIFRTHGTGRISFDQLRDAANETGKIYLEDPSGGGMDYDIFDAPVLTVDQPEGGLELVQTFFESSIVNLGENDLVQEAPLTEQPKLSPKEQCLEKMLGFHPEVLSQYKGPRKSHDKPERSSPASEELPKSIKDQMCRESLHAARDLENIEWRVGHLVGRDGKTPCVTALYLCRGNRVTLNLHHSDIRSLVEVSSKAPELAGHFAMALCITASGRNTVLEHLSPSAREDLINMDAICRCSDEEIPPNEPDEGDTVSDDENGQQDFMDFLRNVQEDDLPF